MQDRDPVGGKAIAVTGACGTVGRELVRQLLEHEGTAPRRVLALDNNESEMFYLAEQWKTRTEFAGSVCDVRDLRALRIKFRDVDTVFHAAALKHVHSCELDPYEAVQTNIEGTQNVIDAARDCDVSLVMNTSSDKAVNPTNVMGTTKLMGERLMTAANISHERGVTRYASTRFGNVLGSRGSVVPLMLSQIASRREVTITDPRMSRFVMSIREAARLVIDSARLARGGEVFITKMAVATVPTLAEALIAEAAPRLGLETSDIASRIIGAKPGEKFYEELMTDEETRRTIELGPYFVVVPAFSNLYPEVSRAYSAVDRGSVTAYRSDREEPLTVELIRDLLVREGLVPADPGRSPADV